VRAKSIQQIKCLFIQFDPQRALGVFLGLLLSQVGKAAFPFVELVLVAAAEEDLLDNE
jgi:hypothetical protein